MKRIILAACFLAGSFASADSFSGVTSFEATQLTGHLTVTCNERGRHDTRSAHCNETVLMPFEFGFFVTEAGVDADSVTIKSTWEDGTVRKKVVGYNKETGKSKSRVNLWIETVFQRALLDAGENKIDYKLKKKGQVVKEGSFVVTVAKGAKRNCGHGSYNSSNRNDCEFPESVCRDFFQRKNYCE